MLPHFCTLIIHTSNFHSESIERFRKIIEQRIVAVREEANRKYGNLVESIPLRLEQIVKQPEQVEPDDDKDDEEQEKTTTSQSQEENATTRRSSSQKTEASESQPGSRKNSSKSVTEWVLKFLQ